MMPLLLAEVISSDFGTVQNVLVGIEAASKSQRELNRSGSPNISKKMKTDLYTKIVLTVIAACLLCLLIKPSDVNLVTEAHAQSAFLQANKPVDVNIISIDGKPFGPNQVSLFEPSLPVQIANKK